MLTYSAMGKDERDECAMLSARAFFDYEYFSCYIADEKRRKGFLKQLFKAEFKANFDSAMFITAKENGRIAAVVMLCPPGYVKPSDAAYVKCGFLKCVIAGGVSDVMKWNAMDTQSRVPCHSLENTWYISLLTVDKEFQGKGVGSRMLREYIIPYVKEHGGTMLSLFTNSLINRKFYEKNGFTMFHEQFFEYKGRSLASWSYKMNIDASGECGKR